MVHSSFTICSAQVKTGAIIITVENILLSEKSWFVLKEIKKKNYLSFVVADSWFFDKNLFILRVICKSSQIRLNDDINCLAINYSFNTFYCVRLWFNAPSSASTLYTYTRGLYLSRSATRNFNFKLSSALHWYSFQPVFYSMILISSYFLWILIAFLTYKRLRRRRALSTRVIWILKNLQFFNSFNK